ncbi:MAG: tetratricopeptide repeat protein [Bacteroidota bacterium]
MQYITGKSIKISALAVILLFSGMLVSAQESVRYDNRQEKFDKAMVLYKHKKYSAAQRAFNEFAQRHSQDDALLKEDAEYFAAMCAMKLYNLDVSHLIEEFIHQHPENPKINQASFTLANHYYRQKKYRSALKWYDKVDKLNLPDEQLSEYYFKKGFCHYARKEYNQADKAFFEIKDKDDFYGPLATYFYSHIKYLNQQYQTALNGFESLSDHALFAQIVPFYITQIYLLQEKYEAIIDYAPPLLTSIESERTAEIARIIAEAHFELENYTKALKYFNMYRENVEEINDVEYYQMAYAHFRQDNYNQAADYFQEVIGVEDSLTQNAAYHLGMCFIHQENKNKAKTAFGIAAQNDFDKNISEDALYNYAKLCFELDYSPFNEAINSLKQFIETYPNSVRIDEAYEYMLDALLSTQNYEAALSVIDDMPNLTPEIKGAYQRLAYYRALESFADLDFENVYKYLDMSLEHKQYSSRYKALAYYWKADALYRQKKYDASIDLFNKFLRTSGAISLKEYGKAHYNIGYAYFKKKNYKEAGIWFRKYEDHVGDTSTEMLCDAWNRIGDSYFVQSSFGAARDYYDKSVDNCRYDADYAYYQKALSQGRLKNHQGMIQSLLSLQREFPESRYKGSSTYQIGRTYHSNLENRDSAIYYYNQYIDNYPNGIKMKSALSGLANLYYNKQQLENSLDAYKTIVAKFPGTNEAVTALEMIKNISVEMNDPDYYVNYIEAEGIDTDITDFEKDSLTYRTAENLYRDNEIMPAIEAFERYLDKYPNGHYILKANYYLAVSCDSEDMEDKALKAYENVISRPNNEFSENAYMKAASISFDRELYDKAFTYYEGLEELTEQKDRLLMARLGMMRAAYLNENYEKMIPAAQRALETEKLNDAQEREAQYKLAKAYYYTDRLHLALSAFKKLSNEVTSYEGGEAKYHVALINLQQGNDTIAENVITEFSKQSSPHRYWLAKSFLLLADIYTDKEAYFQARHILQSVIDNYNSESDGIKLEAQDKLQEVIKLEENEAMQDKSRRVKEQMPEDSVQNDSVPQNNNPIDESQTPEDNE